jgi:hypothetical protein
VSTLAPNFWLVSTEFLGEIGDGVLTTEAFASMEHSIFFTRGSYSSAPQILPVQVPEFDDWLFDLLEARTWHRRRVSRFYWRRKTKQKLLLRTRHPNTLKKQFAMQY